MQSGGGHPPPPHNAGNCASMRCAVRCRFNSPRSHIAVAGILESQPERRRHPCGTSHRQPPGLA
eukprot:915634-Alexandrium_andersonii.AAC.1